MIHSSRAGQRYCKAKQNAAFQAAKQTSIECLLWQESQHESCRQNHRKMQNEKVHQKECWGREAFESRRCNSSKSELFHDRSIKFTFLRREYHTV